MWYVYLLSNGNRTYVGCTTDPFRRLRQHNKELVGGARATAKSSTKWKLRLCLAGFPNRSTACRWEALIKKRARGYENRAAAMHTVLKGECPPAPRGKTARVYDVPPGLTLISMLG